MVITKKFKKKVFAELEKARKNYSGYDRPFAWKMGIHPVSYEKLKSGLIENALRDSEWVSLARELGVSLGERKWNMARTDVFNIIEEEVIFCQKYSKARICADACGIGKTFSAKYLSRTLKNCFYVDASQAKTRQQFIRIIAKTVGLDHLGNYNKVIADLKYYINILPKPIIIIDEAGDLDYSAFLDLKELWNATEGMCGWYLMGADGLKAKIDKGILKQKVGYREIFSRFSDRFTQTVPQDHKERLNFYYKLIHDVLAVNMEDKSQLNEIVKRCLVQDANGDFSGLRRAESFLILNSL